jgi:hypothetical protein
MVETDDRTVLLLKNNPFLGLDISKYLTTKRIKNLITKKL